MWVCGTCLAVFSVLTGLLVWWMWEPLFTKYNCRTQMLFMFSMLWVINGFGNWVHVGAWLHANTLRVWVRVEWLFSSQLLSAFGPLDGAVSLPWGSLSAPHQVKKMSGCMQNWQCKRDCVRTEFLNMVFCNMTGLLVLVHLSYQLLKLWAFLELSCIQLVK